MYKMSMHEDDMIQFLPMINICIRRLIPCSAIRLLGSSSNGVTIKKERFMWGALQIIDMIE